MERGPSSARRPSAASELTRRVCLPTPPRTLTEIRPRGRAEEQLSHFSTRCLQNTPTSNIGCFLSASSDNFREPRKTTRGSVRPARWNVHTFGRISHRLANRNQHSPPESSFSPVSRCNLTSLTGSRVTNGSSSVCHTQTANQFPSLPVDPEDTGPSACGAAMTPTTQHNQRRCLSIPAPFSFLLVLVGIEPKTLSV